MPTSERDFRVPAEFEKQHAVWLGWATYENKRGRSSKSVQVEMIRHMVSHVLVKVAVQDDVEQQSVEKLIREEGIPLNKVEFYRIPHPDLWFRDMGPIFQVTEDQQLRIVDFKFNTWGYRDSEDPYSKAEERVDRDIAKAMGLETVSTWMISEGGNRELNGKGVLLVTKSVETQRNPRHSLEDLEAEYRRLLGVTKVIWLEDGLVEDDSAFKTPIAGPTGKLEAYRPGGTGGHIDQYCRFVSPSTVILAEVSEEDAARHLIAMENRTRMETNFQILKNSTDQDGNPFNVLRMPLPYTLYDYLGPGDVMYEVISELKFEGGHEFPQGERVMVVPACSYHNFVITNGLVLAQSYWKPGMPGLVRQRDEETIAILQQAFPEREVIALDPMALHFGGGGIHCITQQEPVLD